VKRILTLLDGTAAGRENLLAACRVAAVHDATVIAAYPIKIPRDFPIDAVMQKAELLGWPECERARLVGEEFGVTLLPVLCQAYSKVTALLGVARDESADAIALAAPRGFVGWLRWMRGPTRRMVHESRCPVLLIGEAWSPPSESGPDGLLPGRKIGLERALGFLQENPGISEAD
jgi:nucleotide-binding universal stress UspA family protein